MHDNAAIGSDRESILPVDEAAWKLLRTRDVTSTDVSALFNASPYKTHAELFYEKQAGTVPEFDANERMTWGVRLQNAIAEGIGQDNDWRVTPLPHYKRIVSARMAASFDHLAETPDGDAILEIKNVDGLAFRNGWVETDFGLEAPEHIEIQVQAQMHVADVKLCYIGALIGGNRVALLRRDYDPAVGAALEKAVRAFWLSVERNQAPEFDFVRDAELIRQIYATATDGKVITASDRIEQLMREQKEAQQAESAAADIKKAKNAELLTLVGDAARVVGTGFTASCGVTHKGEYVVKASSYRSVRVYQKKEGK